MKAPDKLVFDVATFSDIGIFGVEGEVEYIRKEALLEWAKQKQYDSLTIVQDDFWQEVIDKINSL
jgi:hypothetical protein